VTGSSTCLDPGEAARLGIGLVRLRIHGNGGDVSAISSGEVYERLRAGDRLRTSAATPGDYAAAFAEAPGAVLCLTETPALSSGFAAATVAAESAAGEVRVVDGGTAAGGLRLLAVEAARLAAEGTALDALAGRVGELAGRVEMVGMLETVEYLGRSGRIPQVASWGGSLLRVRPVIRFDARRSRLVGIARSRGRGLDLLRELGVRAAREHGAGPRGEGARYVLFHADACEPALAARRLLDRDLPLAEGAVTEMTPAMGVHVGPGALGLAVLVV
jgi:DegV family protein with EDD domain